MPRARTRGSVACPLSRRLVLGLGLGLGLGRLSPQSQVRVRVRVRVRSLVPSVAGPSIHPSIHLPTLVDHAMSLPRTCRPCLALSSVPPSHSLPSLPRTTAVRPCPLTAVRPCLALPSLPRTTVVPPSHYRPSLAPPCPCPRTHCHVLAVPRSTRSRAAPRSASRASSSDSNSRPGQSVMR